MAQSQKEIYEDSQAVTNTKFRQRVFICQREEAKRVSTYFFVLLLELNGEYVDAYFIFYTLDCKLYAHIFFGMFETFLNINALSILSKSTLNITNNITF